MSFIPFKLWVIVLVIAIAVGVLYAQWGTEHEQPVSVASDTPKISITPWSRDLGTVSVSKGAISAVFEIENTGDGELIISDMETSCMCTEAALVQYGREGPKFGMRGHGARPAGWSAKLAPGEQATLKVYYDPTVHPDLRGAVTRLVRIYSNDPKRTYVDVTIEMIQVD